MPRKPTSSTLVDHAPAFAALGDETRLRLVERLCRTGPMSICRLTANEPITRQAISKHLRALEAAGVVRSRRCGRESIWELRPSRLAEIRLHLDEISSQWDRAIGRLRAMVEEGA